MSNKYMGVDFGSKRVGLAISDDDGILAFPAKVITRESALEYILEEWNRGDYAGVVIGKSLDYKRKPNPIHSKAEEFARKLEGKGVKVYFQDETLTSVEASHIQGKEAGNDASAAAIILQSFIDTRANTRA